MSKLQVLHLSSIVASLSVRQIREECDCYLHLIHLIYLFQLFLNVGINTNNIKLILFVAFLHILSSSK